MECVWAQAVPGEQLSAVLHAESSGLGSPWSSSAGTKDVSSFELSLTFNSDFLHESCFGLDSKTLHRILHFKACFARGAVRR